MICNAKLFAVNLFVMTFCIRQPNSLAMPAPLWSDQAGLSDDSRSFSSEFPNFGQNQIFL